MSSRHISKSDRVKWDIARERFQIPDTKPPSPYRVYAMDQVLPSILKKVGMEDALWEQTLLNEWPKLAGSTVARNARPGRLQHRILHVYVNNSVWLTELRGFGEKALLDRLQERFGKRRIVGIRLQLDPEPTSPPGA